MPGGAVQYTSDSARDRRLLRIAFDLAVAEAGLRDISTGVAAMAKETGLVPLERIERHILLIRDQKVLLDSDLAEMYGVTTSNLNKAVARNRDRFPPDFMFQLSKEEAERLRFQSGTSSAHGGRRYRPYAFTEQGVAMLSSVLRSRRAVDVNIQIMRTFVRLRQMLASNEQLARKLRELEQRYDQRFKIVFDAIRALMRDDEPESKRPRIGYSSERSG